MIDFAGIIKFFILAFIIAVLGFYLFPGMHLEVIGVDTTGWNKLAAGTHELIPYAIIGGIFIGILVLWSRKSSE